MRTLTRRLLHFARRSRHDADLRDEMETHRSLRQEKLEREGVSPAGARRASRRSFGNATIAREDARGVWILPAFDGLWQDVRAAFRASRRVPVSSLTIVLTLVFGLGLASAIFAFGDGYLARPLPFPDDQQLYVVQTNGGVGGRMRANEVEGLRASTLGHVGFVTSGGEMDPLAWAGWLHLSGRRVQVSVGGVSDRFAQVVGVPLVEGRPFGPDDHRGQEPVPVWLSHRFWQREFGGDPAVLNRTLSFQKAFDSDQRVSVVVIGVTDPRVTTFSVNFGANQSLPDLFAPAVERREEADNVFASPIVRLSRNMPREQAEAAIGAVLQANRPGLPGEVRPVRLQSLREHMAGAGRPTALLFLASALLSLALVTVNLIHLLLARGVARAGEIATRSALGASQWRIARLLFVESLIYGTAGIAGGLLVGRWLTHTIAADIPTRGSDTSNLALVAMSFDSRVVVFAVLAGVIVTFFGAAWPVWRTVFRVSGSSHHTQRRSAPRVSSRFSKLTLTCEVAISTVILMGTAFVGLGIWKHVNQPIGYDLNDRFTLSFPASSFSSDGAVDWHGVLEGVRGAPGVRSASVDRIEPVRERLYVERIDLSDRDVTAYSVGAAWLEA